MLSGLTARAFRHALRALLLGAGLAGAVVPATFVAASGPEQRVGVEVQDPRVTAPPGPGLHDVHELETAPAQERPSEVLCCLRGDIVRTPMDACRKQGGRPFDDLAMAQRLCRSAPAPPPPRRAEPPPPGPGPEPPREAPGFCCLRGEVFPAPPHVCAGEGGAFFPEPAAAEHACAFAGGAPPHEPIQPMPEPRPEGAPPTEHVQPQPGAPPPMQGTQPLPGRVPVGTFPPSAPAGDRTTEPAVPAQAVPKIEVLSPKHHADWFRTESFTIKWTSDLPSDRKVRIDVIKDGAPVWEISPSASNTGTFVWTIPAAGALNPTIKWTPVYRVRVTADIAKKWYGESGSFSVRKPHASIASDGEWCVGDSQSIGWELDTSRSVSSIRLRIRNVSTKQQLVDQNLPNTGNLTTPNAGQYTWAVPLSAKGGPHEIVVTALNGKLYGKRGVQLLRACTELAGTYALRYTVHFTPKPPYPGIPMSGMLHNLGKVDPYKGTGSIQSGILAATYFVTGKKLTWTFSRPFLSTTHFYVYEGEISKEHLGKATLLEGTLAVHENTPNGKIISKGKWELN